MKKVGTRIPSYRRHKARDLALVHINGKDHYLGKHNSPESRQAYARLIAQYLETGSVTDPADARANATATATGLTVGEMVLAFMHHAEVYYRRADGTATGEDDNFRDALRPLVKLHERSPAADFGPLALKEVRQSMVDSGRLCRAVVNQRVGKIVRVFRWAASNEMIPASVHHGLKTVSALRKGRSTARETKSVTTVPEAFVEAVLPLVSKQVAAMMRLQMLTGMRPGEVALMRAIDLDTTGPVWLYRPHRHKSEHKEKERVIGLGTKAQEVLRPWLRTHLEAYLFQPIEAREHWNAERREGRKSPMTPSQRARKRKRNPKRKPSHFYTTRSYSHAVHRGCREAGVPVFGPNRLRHNAATRIRREMGLEAAKAVLGHSLMETTQIYAEKDHSLAAEVMAKLG